MCRSWLRYTCHLHNKSKAWFSEYLALTFIQCPYSYWFIIMGKGGQRHRHHRTPDITWDSGSGKGNLLCLCVMLWNESPSLLLCYTQWNWVRKCLVPDPHFSLDHIPFFNFWPFSETRTRVELERTIWKRSQSLTYMSYSKENERIHLGS